MSIDLHIWCQLPGDNELSRALTSKCMRTLLLVATPLLRKQIPLLDMYKLKDPVGAAICAFNDNRPNVLPLVLQ